MSSVPSAASEAAANYLKQLDAEKRHSSPERSFHRPYDRPSSSLAGSGTGAAGSLNFPSSHAPSPHRSPTKQQHSVRHSSEQPRSPSTTEASFMGRFGHAGDSRLSSPSKDASGSSRWHYSYEYVTKLQWQHQQRLSESMEASNRIMATKEAEIASLTERLHQYQMNAADADDRIKQLESEHRSELLEYKHELDRLKQEHSDALDAMSKRHNDELESLKAAHQELVSQTQYWAQQQISTVEGDRENSLAHMKQQQSQLESELSAKLRDSEELHAKQVAELHRLLNAESERLTLAREEICQVTMARGTEVMQLKSRWEAATRTLHEKEEEFRRQLNQVQQEAFNKDKDYQELLRSLRQEVETEREQSRRAADQYTHKIRALEGELANIRRTHEAQVRATQEDIEYLNRSLDSGSKFTQKQLEQNKELVDLVRQLQHENGIMRQEIGLMEHEQKRLREESLEYKHELTRMDKLLYGAGKVQSKTPTSTKAKSGWR